MSPWVAMNNSPKEVEGPRLFHHLKPSITTNHRQEEASKEGESEE